MFIPAFGAQIANEVLNVFQQWFLRRVALDFGRRQTVQFFFLFLQQPPQFFLGHLLVRHAQRNIQYPTLTAHANAR
ncbi:MAG TPA: hypothetical protein VMV89_12185 [Candidatus Paceibacterota bacterium]|nr:hypothetical protein [Candidatus Paceibacterota bacterium]